MERIWNRSIRYLHWLVAVLLVLVWAFVELHEMAEKGGVWRDRWTMLHFSLGALILVLMLYRLILRRRHDVPPFTGPRWQKGLSKLIHAGLYLVVIALPIIGMTMRQFAGKPVILFGSLQIPQWLPVRPELAETLAWLHKDLLWYVFLVLVSVHVIGALWHHFLNRDDTLRHMMPLRR